MHGRHNRIKNEETKGGGAKSIRYNKKANGNRILASALYTRAVTVVCLFVVQFIDELAFIPESCSINKYGPWNWHKGDRDTS